MNKQSGKLKVYEDMYDDLFDTSTVTKITTISPPPKYSRDFSC